MEPRAPSSAGGAGGSGAELRGAAARYKRYALELRQRITSRNAKLRIIAALVAMVVIGYIVTPAVTANAV